MIGHEKIFADLKKLNECSRLGHGYIFYGPSMVGKKLAARKFAEYLEHGANENTAEALLSDFMLIEPGEHGSIGIDAIRGIKNFLWQKPNASSRRTLIIDDAELLTAEAQNALLKVTEEPPASSLLILVTSDAESILTTILSRLPKLYFGTVPEKEIEKLLGEMKGVKDVAKKSFGKPGLAMRLVHDEDFREQIALAEKLLKTPPASRRDAIKKIIEPDEFSFRKFLDAIILVIAWQGTAQAFAMGKKTELWHKALALYDRETNFNLNPRLQLEALLGTL
jgi:DNA polymerase III subunit delta'